MEKVYEGGLTVGNEKQEDGVEYMSSFDSRVKGIGKESLSMEVSQ
jgi:hypothetical protein